MATSRDELLVTSAATDRRPPGQPQSEPKPKRGPNYHMMVPLVYAPLLPLLRIGLTGRVSNVLRDRVRQTRANTHGSMD